MRAMQLDFPGLLGLCKAAIRCRVAPGLILGTALLALPVQAASGPSLASVARDIDRVESVRQIKRVQLAWAHHIDQGAWAEAASLFAQDALIVHGDEQFRGRDRILDYFRQKIGNGVDGLPTQTIHTPFLNAPIIVLAADGDHAHGRWHGFSMRGAFGGDAVWQGGIFVCDYVREKGVWRIARQAFTPYLVGPYATGWTSWKATIPMVSYDFEPEQIGTPAALGAAVAAPGSIRASAAQLAGRIRALEDEALILNLQNAYGYYVDQKMWDDITDLFAPRSRLEIAGVGAFSGPKGARRWIEASMGPQGLRYGEMNDHVQANVVVEVAPDGRHARARGFDIGMVGQNDDKGYWIVTRFDNQFVKLGGLWRIETMRQAQVMKTDYAQGWAKDWQPIVRPAGLSMDGPAPAGLPAPWPLARPAPHALPVAPGSLSALDQAVQRVAAYDAIENLAGGYGQYLDDNHWDELGSLFAAQGERDSAGGGFIRTPARIASFSRQRYGPYNPNRTFANMHMRTQPVIHIGKTGLTGQIRTRLLQMAVSAPAAPGSNARPSAWAGGMIVTGMYEDDLVFEDGRWRIKRADIDHLVYAPYKTGWTHIAEGAGAAMTPSLASVANVKFDAPGAGDTHPAFPKLGHMWFHYQNPVSRRNPTYLMPKYVQPEP